MFLIPTHLAASHIHGIGVFSTNPIPKGTIIWEFHPDVDLTFTEELLSAVPEPFQGKLRSYCYLDTDTGIYVFCGDNGKFMNHSMAPNCDDTGAHHTITLRDIEAGEELTCDYRSFDQESKELGERLFSPVTA